ncbi:MAG: alpha/beta hydrolase [Thiobacillaceae bacterium]
MRVGSSLLLVLMLVALTARAPSWAEPVTLTMPNGLKARADFRKGDADKPAVLILHGFLLTHEFLTVQRLAEGLHGEGHTVLAPTLTLGVPHRRQSLACEAVHKHRLQDDFRELEVWIRWLSKETAGPIVLIGHSFGSTMLTLFLDTHPNPRIGKLIGVSMVEASASRDARRNQEIGADLRQRLARGERRLVSLPLTYCKRYVATPESYLSYQEWSTERILEVIRRIKTPTVMIMGGGDERVGPNWIRQLEGTGKRVHVIPDANHFLDGMHEFDLLEKVLQELKAVHP